MEDLFESNVYEALVKESYKTELQGKALSMNSNIPRIVKRYEDAFTAAGLQFNKTRPAKMFLRVAAQDPTKWITPTMEDRFEKLFRMVNQRLERIQSESPRIFEKTAARRA